MVEVRHLLGVLPLGEADTLLHLLGLGLDIFPKRDESVNCGLERADKWLGIKCYVRDIRSVGVAYVSKNLSTYAQYPL